MSENRDRSASQYTRCVAQFCQNLKMNLAIFILIMLILMVIMVIIIMVITIITVIII